MLLTIIVQCSVSKCGKGKCYLGITHVILATLSSVPSILSQHSWLLHWKYQRVHLCLILKVSIYKCISGFLLQIFLIADDSACFYHLQKITSCFLLEYVILTVLKLTLLLASSSAGQFLQDFRKDSTAFCLPTTSMIL